MFYKDNKWHCSFDEYDQLEEMTARMPKMFDLYKKTSENDIEQMFMSKPGFKPKYPVEFLIYLKVQIENDETMRKLQPDLIHIINKVLNRHLELYDGNEE